MDGLKSRDTVYGTQVEYVPPMEVSSHTTVTKGTLLNGAVVTDSGDAAGAIASRRMVVVVADKTGLIEESTTGAGAVLAGAGIAGTGTAGC